METPAAPGPEDMCSFCGRPRSQVRLLVEGARGAFICDDCIWRLFRDHMSPEAQPPLAPSGPATGHPASMRGETSMSGSFDRFTERARKAITLAQEEAQRFNHNYIGTEHILLGLVREGDGVAGRVLWDMGIELTKIRSAVEFIIGRGERQVMGEIGLTPRAKKVIELAVDEARRLGHHYVGTEHLLLGLIREGEGIAAGVLESLGIKLERVRTAVIKVLGSPNPSSWPQEPGDPLTERVQRESESHGSARDLAHEPTHQFDRFTERARGVLTRAQEEAQRLGQNWIGPEHFLLALAREDGGVAAKVLSNFGIALAKVREAVESTVGHGEQQGTGEVGLTPRAKKVIQLSVDEGRRLGHHYVGTEHLLLALIREGESVAATVLESLGVTLEKTRSEIVRVLSQPPPPESENP
jgi:ATP-dependent Clp protease ATP-binding subunit ClpA